MSAEIKKLVSAAIAGTDAGQKLFADNITTVLEAFQPSSVRDNLIPFLKTWMPYNNKPALRSLASNIAPIMKAAGGIKPAACIVEGLIASEDPETADNVMASLEAYRGDAMLEELVPVLVGSKFDFVRKFVVQVLTLVGNGPFALRTYETLATDSSFAVRYAVGAALKTMAEETAKQLTMTLVKDTHSRVRALLANDLYVHSFYFDIVAPLLIEDKDWSVRATLATAVSNAKEIEKAAPLCVTAIQDGVWQVQMCGLRSLTSILQKNPDFAFTLDISLVKFLNIPKNPLKMAVIDCFFAQRSIENQTIADFVSHMMKEPSEIKIRFLEKVSSKAEYANAILDNIIDIVKKLCNDGKWRIRLGVIMIMEPLADIIQKPAVSAEFMNLCMGLLDDEAYPVRSAAAKHLAVNYVKEGDNIPSVISTMKKTNSFRKRQIAVEILKVMYETATSDVLKEKIAAELKVLEKDEVINVAYLAANAVQES